MKKVKVEDAVGMTLCHDITAIDDHFKGAAFHRGQVITQEDVEKLKNIGKNHIFIWEENAGEIHEEDAALRLSKLCQVEGGACIPAPAREKWCRRPECGACSG